MRRLLLALATTFVAAAGFAAPAAAHHDDPIGWGARGPRFDTKVEVHWGSSWWPATILSARGDQYLIRYDGYSASWDEWVGPDRIRPAGGLVDRWGEPRLVSILWGSQWYAGRVMKASGGRYLVHYDGWSNSFDEWVGADRLRFLDAAPVYTQVPVYTPAPTYRPQYPVRPDRPDRPRHVRPSRDEWPSERPVLYR